MSDNPLDGIPNFDRISVRAVLVADGEDPGQALAAAGIVDPIAVPVVFGEAAPGIGFGDGITPNLTAVLEPDPQAHAFDPAFGADDTDAGYFDADSPDMQTRQPGPDDRDRSEPVQVNLPAAFGSQPLAPARRPGRMHQTTNRVSATPPVPAFQAAEPETQDTSDPAAEQDDRTPDLE